MRGMILAAGRGQRMGALTESIPKPLLSVAGHYLIEYAIYQLVQYGITDIVINVSYRGEQIKSALGDGSRYGATFLYSEEEVALETGGGIVNVLSFFEQKPFVVLSSDVISDYPLSRLFSPFTGLAHLILVNNPTYHPEGDFVLRNNQLYLSGGPMLTFANIGMYHPDLFRGCQPNHFRLGDLLKKAISQHSVSGEVYQGLWYNIGTQADWLWVNEWIDSHPISLF